MQSNKFPFGVILKGTVPNKTPTKGNFYGKAYHEQERSKNG